MKVSVLIPAKGFLNAKKRLSPLLGIRDRELLAEAMLKDVLGQVVSAGGSQATLVVTGDDRVGEISAAFGAEVLREEEERGETPAVEFALAELKRRGVRAALVIPADIPLVRQRDIEELIASPSRHGLKAPFAVLVPSHDRMGSNALLLSPPDLIRLRFGYDSFSYHLAEAARSGAPFREHSNPRIALDIDEPSDLRRFLRSTDRCGETYAAVVRAGVAAAAPEEQRQS